MPIEFPCRCGQQLRVPDEHAGSLARCPRCKRDMTVPNQSVAPAAAPALDSSRLSAQPSAASSSAGASPDWFVKTPDGQRHGPLARAEVDAWRTAGRLNRDCEVLETGWSQWKWADEVFPELAGASGAAAAPGPAPTIPPAGSFAPAIPPRRSEANRTDTPAANINPYASASDTFQSYRSVDYRLMKPHRGGQILGMGIGSLVLMLCVCGIFGLALAIPTWVMASSDLGQMKRGEMDPSGEGSTRTGMILAIVATCLGIVGTGLYAFIILMDVAGRQL